MDTRTESFPNDALRAFAESVLRDHGIRPSPEAPLIGLNLGVNWESKHYFEERYAVVAKALVEQREATILVFGGPDDLPKAEAVLAGIRRRDRVVSLAGKTRTPNHAAAVIALCALFITNDTGVMDLVAAVGVPTVAIFGGTHRALHAPRPGGTQIERPHKGIARCSRSFAPPLRF
jgi:heptosyltransferase-2